MGEYVILTDSSADLTAELVAELGVEVIPLSFTMEDKTYFNYPDNRDIDPADFYARLRGGRHGHHRRRQCGRLYRGH